MKPRRRLPALVCAVALITIVAAGAGGDSEGAPASGANALAAPESFSGITDPHKRSAAYFAELAKVLTNPRCTNCHPAGDRPRQGDMRRLHQPPVFRGKEGFGLEAMRCPICHQSANFAPGRVPGRAGWHLAPGDMAWEGRTISQICAQIKDPARNGNRSLHDLIEHIGTDPLVGWAWAPGFGRTPAPGTQKEAGALVKAWVDSGAACP
jgi:hypothetical protein